MQNNEIKIVTSPINLSEVKEIAEATFVEYAKAVVDIEKKIMGVGGQLQSDIERVLLEQGCAQTNLWGINLYPDNYPLAMVEFDSMINIRPRQNNRSRGVEDPEIRTKITELVKEMMKND